jgi:hypothetical protein
MAIFKHKLNNSIVEAEQWDVSIDAFDKITKNMGARWNPGPMLTDTFYVETDELGYVLCQKNDYVGKSEDGKFFLLKPDAFEMLFEKEELIISPIKL